VSGGLDAAQLKSSGIRLVLGTTVDYSGVVRAKGVPAPRLDAFVDSGMGASPSWVVFCVDFGIAFTPDLGVVGDLRLRVDPDRLVMIDNGIAWAPATMYHQDGTVFRGCPRARLTAVLQRVADARLSAKTGAELEFVLVHPDGSPLDGEPWNGYGVRAALRHGGLLVDLVKSFDDAGLGVEQIHTEYGANQVELSLSPSDPLCTADNTVLARILIGRAAARAGLGVSFSPVPFAGSVGNGAHLHMSLERDGTPLFSGSSGPHGISAAGGSAIAGILSALPDLQGVLAGSAVSAFRLQPQRWSGAFACWGLENREAALRFIEASASNPLGANLEIKIIDGSANPYLVPSVLLGAALDGIEAGLELPAEVTVDPATLPDDEKKSIALAADQATALDRLASSLQARALLGDDIHAGVLAVRRYEQTTFGGQNPDAVTAAFRLAFSC
jgi:glutamine synthetase